MAFAATHFRRATLDHFRTTSVYNNTKHFLQQEFFRVRSRISERNICHEKMPLREYYKYGDIRHGIELHAVRFVPRGHPWMTWSDRIEYAAPNMRYSLLNCQHLLMWCDVHKPRPDILAENWIIVGYHFNCIDVKEPFSFWKESVPLWQYEEWGPLAHQTYGSWEAGRKKGVPLGNARRTTLRIAKESMAYWKRTKLVMKSCRNCWNFHNCSKVILIHLNKKEESYSNLFSHSIPKSSVWDTSKYIVNYSSIVPIFATWDELWPSFW